MAKIGLPKGSGKQLKVREKSVKSQGILKWILSGNPAHAWDFRCAHSLYSVPDLVLKTITIHHERPCRIEISHPRGRKFNQGRGLPSPWLNSDPEGEISLSYMDRLMMDRFSPTFRRVFVRT